MSTFGIGDFVVILKIATPQFLIGGLNQLQDNYKTPTLLPIIGMPILKAK